MRPSGQLVSLMLETRVSNRYLTATALDAAARLLAYIVQVLSLSLSELQAEKLSHDERIVLVVP